MPVGIAKSIRYACDRFGSVATWLALTMIRMDITYHRSHYMSAFNKAASGRRTILYSNRNRHPATQVLDVLNRQQLHDSQLHRP